MIHDNLMTYAIISPPDSRYDTGMRDTASQPASRRRPNDELQEGSYSSRIRTTALAAVSRIAASLDGSETQAAVFAANEAAAVVRSLDVDTLPWIGVTDEGIVMLQWQTDSQGVMLSFSGDGAFSVAKKQDAAGRYADNYQDYRVADGLPSDCILAIRRIVSEVRASITR